MLKQTLQQTQTTKLSPLQIQTIKLLELPMLELEQKIQREIEENPVLDEVIPESEEEEAANVALDSYDRDDPTPSINFMSIIRVKISSLNITHFPSRKAFHQSYKTTRFLLAGR